MKKFKFNFSFLDRFKTSKKEAPESLETLENSNASEFDSDESPEVFAEKTLSGFDVKQYQEQLKAAANEETSQEAEQDQIDEIDEDESQEQFIEMKIPKAPSSFSLFNFKFPKFNHQGTAEKIKASFSKGTSLNSLENSLDKFTWDYFVLRLFSPYTRARIHGIFIILLVVVITYMVGKNIALVINKAPPVAKNIQPSLILPPQPTDSTIQDVNKIASINLFNAKESDKSIDGSKNKDIDSIICLEAEAPTSLQIKLLDTIVLQDSVKSVASVQVRGNSELMNVREGDRLFEMAEVSKIDRMKVILKNLQTGNCEYAATEEESEPDMPNYKIVSPQVGKSLFKSTNPNIKNTGNSFKIKKNFRDSMINNMSDVLTQAKAVQITNPDGSLCFKMTEVVAGSIYSQLDIQENDIICNINGKKIDNLNELMNLLGRIKEIDQFQIGLKRNGMSENKEYGFE
jgi:type II secretory pathway component PulC